MKREFQLLKNWSQFVHKRVENFISSKAISGLLICVCSYQSSFPKWEQVSFWNDISTIYKKDQMMKGKNWTDFIWTWSNTTVGFLNWVECLIRRIPSYLSRNPPYLMVLWYKGPYSYKFWSQFWTLGFLHWASSQLYRYSFQLQSQILVVAKSKLTSKCLPKVFERSFARIVFKGNVIFETYLAKKIWSAIVLFPILFLLLMTILDLRFWKMQNRIDTMFHHYNRNRLGNSKKNLLLIEPNRWISFSKQSRSAFYHQLESFSSICFFNIPPLQLQSLKSLLTFPVDERFSLGRTDASARNQ